MRILIIGNGVAGNACAQEARRLNSSARITILSAEPFPFYSKSLLSHFLSKGYDRYSVAMKPASFYNQNKIEVKVGIGAERIDPDRKVVKGGDGKGYEYDALLIATGASPNFPKSIRGLKKEGVFGLRTLKDVDGILGTLSAVKRERGEARAVIIGAGLLGLESAVHLKEAGFQVTVVEIEERPLATVIDEDLCRWLNLKERFLEAGFDLRLSAQALEVLGDKRVRGIALKQGERGYTIEADCLLVGTGVVANTALAEECGIEVNRGIIADEFQRTSAPDIYTAGDVAETFDFITGGRGLFPIWPVAAEQGRVAARNICGLSERYPGAVNMNSFTFFSIPVCCIGLVKVPDKPGYEELLTEDKGEGFYYRLTFQDDMVVGAVLAGDIGNAGAVYRLIRERRPVKDKKETLDALQTPTPKGKISLKTLY